MFINGKNRPLNWRKKNPLPETERYRQVIRRRLTGTAVILVVTFLLWKIGGEPPPQKNAGSSTAGRGFC